VRPPVFDKKLLPWIAAVLALSFGLYLNSLPNDFNFDDNTLIRENTLIRKLSNLPRIFISNYWANTAYEKGVLLYRPLAVATFAIDYALWGNNPFGFHLTNALLNALNAALVLLLLRAIFGENAGVLPVALASLLFAFHPVHTEAVNMIVGRTELLAACFGLLTYILYLRGWSIASVAAFFLALLSKEIAVTVPIMLLIFDWLRGRKFNKTLYLCFGAVAALYLAIRFAVLRGFVAVHQTGILDQQDIFHRGLTVAKVLGYYLKLLVIPYPLTPDYSDIPLPNSIASLWVVGSIVVIVGLLWCAWNFRRAASLVSLAIIWFFVTIAPVSNLVSIGAFLGERFLYLPSISLALLAAGVLFGRSSGARSRSASSPAPLLKRIYLVAVALVLAVFATLTFSRNLDWKNADTLWAKVLAHQPDNPRANYHLGSKYDEEKDYQRAIPFYEKAIQRFPEHNWNPDRATVQRVRQRLSAIFYILAVRSYKENKFQDAIDHAKRAVTDDPNNAPAYVVIGNVYAQQGDLQQAAQLYKAALKADPEQFEAKENLKRVESFQPK
jgi:tetratricopeptide (TPR) repeat protein